MHVHPVHPPWVRHCSELLNLFKNSKSKFKNGKHRAVDVLFQAYLMVPLSCRSNLAGRYL
jgi:hypothetical protein